MKYFTKLALSPNLLDNAAKAAMGKMQKAKNVDELIKARDQATRFVKARTKKLIDPLLEDQARVQHTLDKLNKVKPN